MRSVRLIAIFVAAGCILLKIVSETLNKERFKKVLKISFFIYIAAYIVVTLFRERSESAIVYMKPFRAFFQAFDFDYRFSVKDFIKHGDTTGASYLSKTALKGLLLNILLYVPMSFLLCFYLKRWKKLFVLPLCVTVSIATEFIQYVLKIGCTDIDDVINNTAGAVIGMVLFGLISVLEKLISGALWDKIKE